MNIFKTKKNKNKFKLKKAKPTTKVQKVTYTKFRPYVLSRHPSHNPLRTGLPLLPFRSLIRLGSTTVLNDGKNRLEINSTQGVANSSNKRLMKRCFNNANIKHASWIDSTNITEVKNWVANNGEFPIIAKHVYGSRGTGNYLLKTQEEFNSFINSNNLSSYIFERYYNFNREYRLHVTKNGCFYTCRKMLKRDTPKDKKFQRHDDNCSWFLENNSGFDKPVNWNTIVNDCVKAANSLGLDICCFDVKVQSSKDKKGVKRTSPEYIIIESGSAPSFGDTTLQKYIEVLPELIRQKKNGS